MVRFSPVIANAFATAACAAILALAILSAAVSTVALANAGIEKASLGKSGARVATLSRECTVTAQPATDPVTGASATQLVRTCA